MIASLLLLLPPLATAHVWYPDGHKSPARELTTSDTDSACLGASTSFGKPKWTSNSGTDAFLSYHLHLAWASGNTQQSTGAAKFLSLLTSSAGASSTCSATTDTTDLFCYSMTITDYDTAQKQDPFYSKDAFIFMGKTFFSKGVSWAMRYRSADLAASYDVDAFVHPNSGCPGYDHLRWSLVLARTQHPFNTCPFWFQSFCGFRRNLNAVEHLAPLQALVAPGSRVDEVILERGRAGRALASTSSSKYSTSSCSTWSSATPGFSSYSFFLVWNTMNADEVAAKELFLAAFASMFSVTRGAGGSCANYAHKPASAGTAILMCTEVTAAASSNWFPAPYGYANIYVPSTYFASVTQWFMRNHDNAQMNSITAFSLPYFITPNTGCTYYDFEEWSAKSPNNTVAYNYYPMTATGALAAFSTAITTGTANPDLVAMSSTTCTVLGWKIFAPYLYNQLTAWSNNPKFASTFNTNLNTKLGTSYFSSAQYASTSYAASTTMAFSTAYYQYTIPYTTATFAKALKYAILSRVTTKVDSTTYKLHSQPVLLQRNSGCADYDALLFQGHTDAFDWPMNREALTVGSYFGGASRRSLREGELPQEVSPIPQDHFVRRLFADGCISAYDLNTDQTNSWTLHVTFVNNNPTNVARAQALCATLYSTYGGASCTTPWAYTTTSAAYYGVTSVKVMGLVSPVSTTATATGGTSGTSAAGLQSTYSYAINVPDAYLSTLLQTVMPYTAHTSDVNKNLGWFLVPNLVSTATATACSLSDLYTNFYMQEEPRPWVYSTASGTSTTLTTSLSTSGARALQTTTGTTGTTTDSAGTGCGTWTPSTVPSINFAGYLRKFYCDPLGMNATNCLIVSMFDTRTNKTEVYNATSFINGNEYLPPLGCIPTPPTSTNTTTTSGGKREVRELAAAFTNTYSIQINGAETTAVQELFASVESGTLTGSSTIASVWAEVNGLSASSVTHAPFQGGVDAMGNKFSAIAAGGIASAQAPLVIGTDGTTNPTTGTTTGTTTSSTPTCGDGCIAGAVVGSVVGAVLLASLVYAHYKNAATAAAALAASSAAKQEAATVTVRAAASV